MIEFRPHHFLCTLGFIGEGYSPDFVANFQKIAERLRNRPDGDQVKIQVVKSTDSICSPCPNRRNQLCEMESKIQQLDQAHARVLELKTGETMTWGEAKERIARLMSIENFHQACEPCGWKSMGVCQSALENLRKAKK